SLRQSGTTSTARSATGRREEVPESPQYYYEHGLGHRRLNPTSSARWGFVFSGCLVESRRLHVDLVSCSGQRGEAESHLVGSGWDIPSCGEPDPLSPQSGDGNRGAERVRDS